MNKKVYFAHPKSKYNTKEEEVQLQLLKDLGYDVVNPNTKETQENYKTEGFNIFYKLIDECDALAFRRFNDLKIGAGVFAEIEYAYSKGKPVFELPCIRMDMVLSIEKTRVYCKYPEVL